MITQKRLKELLHYDPETGLFTWKVSRGGVKAGSITGCYGCHGYLRISIDGKRYLSHRLAFLYIDGAFPPEQVDHINEVKDDNRWCNLRHATHGQNQKNQKSINGYSFDPGAGKYRANTRISGRIKHLGLFRTKLAAAYAYHAANLEVWT